MTDDDRTMIALAMVLVALLVGATGWMYEGIFRHGLMAFCITLASELACLMCGVGVKELRS